ncbi:hypothetical protein PNP85_06485 [Halobacterium salinarum]|jgi:hypothetical protein|uniref:hypothetical protein n=1 Tax=Halobacterium salinarum TaxID=2242 RepID=UPI00255516B7|nr:hypothetical protein [Halobacterium salinarum]MDL0135832.1 hypothetical protein [Halobacterium salinarum]MDL0139148.1 hypothetical protein [Halobacterium salinarum]
MTYYPDRNDEIEEKRKLAEAFLENPARDAFATLVAHGGFWATETRGSIDHYVDDIVFEDQTPDEVATAVERALKDTDGLEEVLDLDGFGWATTTELLHVLVPDTYAILNKRAVAGMEALGHDPPNRQTASVEEYWDFVDDVQEAYETYDLRVVVNESESAPDVPENHTDLEAADAAFNAHYDEDAYDIDLAALREARTGGRRLEVPEELWERIEAEVAGDPTYRDVEDFLYSAVRNELNRDG